MNAQLQWLQTRMGELAGWLYRSWADLPDWRFDGEPIALGARWPARDGVRVLEHPRVDAPGDRLLLDLGGEGLLQVLYDDGEETFGLDAEHRAFPLRGAPFALRVEIVGRLPFGTPNRDARLGLARVVEVDAPLEHLIRRLQLVCEAAGQLELPELIDAAKDA